MYLSFAMEAQADATRCCIIVILIVQLSLEEMPAEMIPDQVCVTISPSDDCTTKQLEIDKKWVFSIFFASLTLQ